MVMRAAGGVPSEQEINTVLNELTNLDKTSISFLEFRWGFVSRVLFLVLESSKHLYSLFLLTEN